MKPNDIEYQKLVEDFRNKIRGNIESKSMSPEECAQEIKDMTGGVFIEPIQTIEPTGPELDLIAHGLKTGDHFVPIKRKRGRPKGSRNKPKNA